MRRRLLAGGKKKSFICSTRCAAALKHPRTQEMAFRPSLSGREETSLILTERDTADTYACPTIELSRAVSVSLGLDSVSSPLGTMNPGGSGCAFADCDPTSGGNGSRGAPDLLGPPGSLTPGGGGGGRHVPADSSLREDDFGEVCQGMRQVSCMDLFRYGDVVDDGQTAVTRGSVISRYVCKEPSVFVDVPAAPQGTEVVPLKPYSAYSADSSLYRDAQGSVWCANERAYSEPRRSDAPGVLCKYCNCAQTTTFGSRQVCNCLWYRRGGEPGGKGTMQAAAAAQAYGQVESYPDANPQGQSAFSSIKTEPSVWVDCTDRSFR